MGAMRRRQRGYLFEVPVLLFLLLAGVMLLMPRLPASGRRVLAVVGALPLLWLLYALMLAPGWQPGAAAVHTRRLRIAVFLLLGAALLVALVLFVLH